MSLYERFAETHEEGFREQFIRPLLIQLGFIGITNKHGSQEFGKDYVFSELDRFGHMRHMVVQAKHEESINQGKKVDDLLSQVRQAFHIPFTLPSSPAEKRFVSSVYVFNTGAITPNAEKQICESLDKAHVTNVHFFSGDQLDAIRGTHALLQDRQVRARINGLTGQLTLNIEIWQSLKLQAAQRQSLDVREGLLYGLEQFLTDPFITTPDIIQHATALWQQAKIIKAIVNKYTLGGIVTEPASKNDHNYLVKLCDDATSLATSLIRKLLIVSSGMHPITI